MMSSPSSKAILGREGRADDCWNVSRRSSRVVYQKMGVETLPAFRHSTTGMLHRMTWTLYTLGTYLSDFAGCTPNQPDASFVSLCASLLLAKHTG